MRYPGNDTDAARTGAVFMVRTDDQCLVPASGGVGEVSAGIGGLPGSGVLAAGDMFGAAVAPLGDLNGDAVPDFCAGAPGHDGGRGAVYVLFAAAELEVGGY